MAGGIGVTPFRSIVFSAAHEKLPHRIFLFYSNRRPEDAPFLEEFQALERDKPELPVRTHHDRPGELRAPLARQDRLHRLGNDRAESAGGALHAPIYYIAGPPGMVHAMQRTLQSAGVDTDDIRTEEFAGY